MFARLRRESGRSESNAKCRFAILVPEETYFQIFYQFADLFFIQEHGRNRYQGDTIAGKSFRKIQLRQNLAQAPAALPGSS